MDYIIHTESVIYTTRNRSLHHVEHEPNLCSERVLATSESRPVRRVIDIDTTFYYSTITYFLYIIFLNKS